MSVAVITVLCSTHEGIDRLIDPSNANCYVSHVNHHCRLSKVAYVMSYQC